MTDRRAERYDPRDTDPLTVDEDDMCPRPHTVGCDDPTCVWGGTWHHHGTYTALRDAETRDEFRSGAVVLYLAVILAIVAGAAIALLWWELGR